jgi:peptidoglycan/LPS O-acetylase OafA/YrhL
LGHTYVFHLTISDNIVHVVDNLHNSFGTQLILGAVFGVDTFFFISGFLTVYIFINKFKDQGKLFDKIMSEEVLVSF